MLPSSSEYTYTSAVDRVDMLPASDQLHESSLIRLFHLRDANVGVFTRLADLSDRVSAEVRCQNGCAIGNVALVFVIGIVALLHIVLQVATDEFLSSTDLY